MSLITNLQADFLLRKGQSFVEKGKITEALVAYDKALAKKPDYKFVHLHKGIALSRSNEYKKAVSAVERAINSDQSNDVFWYLLGITHFDHKNYEAAIEALERAQKPSASCTAPLRIIGLCKMSGSETFEDGYSLIKKDNKDLRYSGYESRLLFFCETFLFNKGEKKSILNQFGEMNAVSDIGLFGDRSFDISLLMRIFKPKAAKVYLQAKDTMHKGDLDGAMASFSKAIEFDKTMVEAYKQRIQILYKKGEYEEALKISMAVPKEIKDLEILYAQGFILHNLNRYKEAADLFKRLCTEYRPDFSSYYCWGLCQIALQDERAALECFEKAVEFLHTDIAMKRLHEVHSLNKKVNIN